MIVGTLGQVRGNGVIDANVSSNGLISPGTSPGALQITGNYVQNSDGKLLIELGGVSIFDQLIVTGDATLAGQLTVSLVDSFIPTAGQSFTFLTSGDVNDTFILEVLPSVPNLAFAVIYNAESVVLTVLPALPGDYNLNGTVDAADFVLWRNSTPGAPIAPYAGADGNGNGFIDAGDYNIWRARFGETIGSGAGATASTNAAVPEPTALALLLLTGAVALPRRPRRRVRIGSTDTTQRFGRSHEASRCCWR